MFKVFSYIVLSAEESNTTSGPPVVYRMSRQDNAIFVEQSFSTEVVSYFYVP